MDKIEKDYLDEMLKIYIEQKKLQDEQKYLIHLYLKYYEI